MTPFLIRDTPIVPSAIVATARSRGWVVEAPRSPAEWRARAHGVIREATPIAQIRPAFGTGAHLLDRIEPPGETTGAGVVVTTGQQPGLFGGPMYTLHKALSALELARAIERHTGVAAVPVFWAATDDADFAEAATTAVAAPDGAVRLALTTRAADGTPMSSVRIGEEARALYARLRTGCGSIADPRALDAAGAFAPGATIGDAYVTMLRALLEPLGIAVLDASHRAVADAARPWLARAVERAAPISEALQAQAAEIVIAGHTPPVDVDRALSLVFAWEAGPGALPHKRRLAVGEPMPTPSGRASPNVLLRPVVERALLPTVAYVAGPGELAYFAQTAPVAELLALAPPLAVPRWSGLTVTRQTASLLERHSLSDADLVRDGHAEMRIARAALADGEADALEGLRHDIAARLDALRGSLPRAALDGARTQFDVKLARLERRLLAQVKRRESDALRAISAARGELAPFGKPQERALNAVQFWTRFGDEWVRALRNACGAHAERVVSGAAEAV